MGISSSLMRLPNTMFHRIEHHGHGLEHGDFVPELGKGTADHPIAQYSLDIERFTRPNLITTYARYAPSILHSPIYQGRDIPASVEL
jgi:hypothetical protein